MENQNFEIVKYSESYRGQVLYIWEKSVLATHNFLNPLDFQSIKELVKTIDFNNFSVYCLLQNRKAVGFIGVAEQKIEMLFLLPDYIGHGFGKKLMDFALLELKADKVDVNEQNTKAFRFYQKFGFYVYERTDKDDQGNNYPLLRMKLEPAVK